MPLANKWVAARAKKSLVVGVSEMVVSNDAGAELVTYSLGSCVGVSVYDPANKIGGLLHLMLPDSGIHPAKAKTRPAVFVDTGVPRLFHALYDLGADRKKLVVKAAGGARFLDTCGIFNIGERNQRALVELLARNGFSLEAEDFGGVACRTFRLDLETGMVKIQTPGVEPYFL